MRQAILTGRLAFHWLLGLMLITQAGCSHLSRPQAGRLPGGSASPYSLAELETWHLEGRMGIQTRNDAWQAHIVWDHELRQDRVQVLGPLNQGAVSIVLREGMIYIHPGSGEAVLSREPEQALRERLGFAVPLYSVRYWILGLPDPLHPHVMADDTEGNPLFRHTGWEIGQSDFRLEHGYRIPGRLRIQGEDVKLKLVIDQWQAGIHP